MEPADIQAFVARDWGLVERLKEHYWSEEASRMTPADALRLADALRQHVLALRPDWPTPRDREEDLEVHIRVGEALRRVPPPSRS